MWESSRRSVLSASKRSEGRDTAELQTEKCGKPGKKFGGLCVIEILL